MYAQPASRGANFIKKNKQGYVTIVLRFVNSRSLASGGSSVANIEECITLKQIYCYVRYISFSVIPGILQR